jgi:hypothetical protein
MIGENSMRKILLAGAAMLAVSGVAAATTTTTTPSTQTTIQATVNASCQTPTSPASISFGTDPNIGATAAGSVTFQCNFVGDNSGALKINFTSTHGGIKNGSSVKTYDLVFNTVTTSSTALVAPGYDAPTTLAAANTPTTKLYDLVLTQKPDVQGSYQDTLTIAVSY